MPNRDFWHIGKADPRPTCCVRPNNTAGRMDISFGFRKVQAQAYSSVDLKRGRGLNGHTVLADVQDFVQVEHHSAGASIQTCVGRSVDLVPHTAPTIPKNGIPFPARVGQLGRKGLHVDRLHITPPSNESSTWCAQVSRRKSFPPRMW